MPFRNGFGNISRANHPVSSAEIPGVADQEGGHLAGGVSVIGSANVRVGLQDESNVGVPDPLTDHLRTYAGVERTGGLRAAQIMGDDPR